MASTLDRVAYEAGRILKFVAAMVAQDGGPRAFINSLGWELPPGVDDLGLVVLPGGLVDGAEPELHAPPMSTRVPLPQLGRQQRR